MRFSRRSFLTLSGGVAMSILMKSGVYEPEALIDISGVEELVYIEETPSGGVRIGATAAESRTPPSGEDHRSHRWGLCHGSLSSASAWSSKISSINL